jgi:hypothetical protein
VQASPQQIEPHHTPFGGDWAADIRGAGAAYARFANPTGTLVLTMEREYEPCGVPNSGGRAVTIGVSVDGRRVGTVEYVHLVSVEVRPGVIPNGSRLGDMITSAPVRSRCWGNTHTHVEARNQTGRSCFLSRHLNSDLDATSALGVLGGAWTARANAVCPTGSLDVVTRDGADIRLVGWAWHAHAPDEPVRIQAVVDHRPAGETDAAVERADVGRHGFDFRVPADGKPHTVCATALAAAGAPDVGLSRCLQV